MRRLRRDGDPEAGVSVLEVVLLTPLVMGFVLILVCFGILVNARGTVQGAARDAARIGSLQRSDSTADDQATQTAYNDLGGTCSKKTVTQVDPVSKQEYHGFGRGELYTIQVTCTVSLSGLDWFSLGDQTITSYSTAPLDTFRRTN